MEYDEELSHTKRKRYDPHTYARLLSTMTQLVEDVPKLRPDRDVWDIEGDWAATGTIYFVDAIHQPLFDSIREFDCRTIKLVNFGKPAVRITFYRKHRYWLLKDKDLPADRKIEQIQSHINNLVLKAEIMETKLAKTPAPKLAEVRGKISAYWEQVNTWRDILSSAGQYEIAVSNYSRQHFYVTVNYKYRLPSGDFANAQEHLLNTQRDRLGNITQIRYNVLFVDSTEILHEHPYQNREVEGYLNNFSISSDSGRHTIYARIRSDIESTKLFK